MTTNNNDTSVRVNDSTGVIVLGLISIILLFALLRSQRQMRELLREQAENERKRRLPGSGGFRPARRGDAPGRLPGAPRPPQDRRGNGLSRSDK